MGEECGEDKCCDSGKECCCDSGKESCCETECCEGQSKAKMMMYLANEAWSELLKDKMKAAYEKSIGDKMNKIAHISVEACIAYWGNKMKESSSWEEFEEKLKAAME